MTRGSAASGRRDAPGWPGGLAAFQYVIDAGILAGDMEVAGSLGVKAGLAAAVPARCLMSLYGCRGHADDGGLAEAYASVGWGAVSRAPAIGWPGLHSWQRYTWVRILVARACAACR